MSWDDGSAGRDTRAQTNTGFEDFFASGTPAQQHPVTGGIVNNSGGGDFAFPDDGDDADTSGAVGGRWSTGGTFTGVGGTNAALREVSDEEDDDDDGEDLEQADMTMFHAPPVSPTRTVGKGVEGLYSVTFETERKLGMLLERQDDWVPGNNGQPGLLKECTVVKLIVDHGAADVKGVSLGSKVIKVNEIECRSKSYLETLELVKVTPRPLTLVMEKGQLSAEECVSGFCLTRKSVGPIPPSVFSTWKRRYFVLGGAVANKNVLQVYKSKADYEKIVVSLFERKKVNLKLKAYKLTPGFRLSNIKSVKYQEIGSATVYYFAFMPTTANFKNIKFGSDNRDNIQELHRHMSRYL